MIRNIILLFMFNELLARKYLAASEKKTYLVEVESKEGHKRLDKSRHKKKYRARSIGVQNKEHEGAGNDYSLHSPQTQIKQFGQNKEGHKRLGKSGHRMKNKATIGVQNREHEGKRNDYSIGSYSHQMEQFGLFFFATLSPIRNILNIMKISL